ncbi:MAG: hypothetical protein ACYSUT_00310 [Planctomycetota bacterium]|jgi:ABC-type transport system involved in multi-copper enzyme maturation permease subunit
MHSVWAVTRNTVAQAIRMRVAIVVFLLLLILLPLMSMVMTGDGTLLGKLQTFTSYGLGLISFLMSILTIAISTYTLSNDIKRKSIFLVLTKPIHRFELLLGKLLGIILINAVLLTLFGGILYGCTMLIPRMTDAPGDQTMRAEFEFFTSRVGIKPEMDYEVLYQKAQERFEAMRDADQLPEGMSASRVMGQLRGQEIMKVKSVAPGQAKEWRFDNVRVKNAQDPDTVIFIRYKYAVTVPPPNEQVLGMWRIGDLRQFTNESQEIVTPVYRMEMEEATRTMHEFAVPAAAITEDGFLALGFFNNPAVNRTTIIPEELEILYKTGTYTENYIRVLLLMMIQLIFLATLGVSLSTWLSFPVAILVNIAVYFTGLINFFIMSAIEGIGEIFAVFYVFVIKPILWLLPHFDQMYQPSWYIVDGKTLPLSFLLMTFGVTVCVKALLFLLAGMFIFSRREIAKAAV